MMAFFVRLNMSEIEKKVTLTPSLNETKKIEFEGYTIELRGNPSGFIDIVANIKQFSFKDVVTAKISRRTKFREGGRQSAFKLTHNFEPSIRVASRTPKADLCESESLKAMRLQGESLVEVTHVVEKIIRDEENSLLNFFSEYDNARRSKPSLAFNSNASKSLKSLSSIQISNALAEAKLKLSQQKAVKLSLSTGQSVQVSKGLFGKIAYQIDDVSIKPSYIVSRLMSLKPTSMSMNLDVTESQINNED
ncbi:hypothetical protein VCHA53O466_50525 [Vibrio chagasii]|nr:hypothetical protein VCHA53O466_50525 [Vibrio chagasii]